MRILLLTPIHKEYNLKNVKKIYGISESQSQASWIKALQKSRHTVSVFKYTDSIIIPEQIHTKLISFFEKYTPVFLGRIRRRLEKYYKYNPENMLKSHRFEKTAMKFKPDIIIVSGGISSILPESIRKIKSICNSKVFLFSGVNPNTSVTKLEEYLISDKLIDLVVENDRGYAENWKKLGVSTCVLPISSVDPKKHKKMKLTNKEQAEYGCDICFVGSITKDRIKKLKGFTQFDFKFWGDIKPGVKIPLDLVLFYQGIAHGEEMIKIFNAAKIVLNFQPHDMTSGGNMRTFEVAGSGAFQLADRVDSAWFTDKKEVVLFSDIKDAIQKTQFYLEHDKERRSIAERGFQQAHKNHTYEKHFKKLLS